MQGELDRKHYIAKVHNPLKESGLPFDVLPLISLNQIDYLDLVYGLKYVV